MRSPTQLDLSTTDISAIVQHGLGATITDASELSGGTFAAVWRAGLADGRQVVVKVAPSPTARMLRYEAGLIEAEAEYFGMVRSLAPVPEVLAVSPTPALPGQGGWIITTLLPGTPLSATDSPRAREQLGAAIARVHTVTGDRFGYTGERPSGDSWPAAFTAIIDALRADADDWNVPLPPLDGVVERYHDTLATVTRPALLHFDLWDGNVLAGPDGELTGVVDGERYLYGDPLFDFVSPAIMRRIEDLPDHPFLAGYRPDPFDEAARVRLALYRIHLYVLMIAEGPSRGIPIANGRHDRLTGLLTQELADLP
jgi:aminoglycoside phosphotransferase (APT) family kinase protein